MLLCPAFSPLPVKVWMSLPLLFLCGTCGVGAVLTSGLGPESSDGDVALSAPPLFGMAAALSLLSSTQVRWTFAWQRHLLRFPYPAVLLVCALGLNQLRLPLLAALIVGGVAVALLTALTLRTCTPPENCVQAREHSAHR